MVNPETKQWDYELINMLGINRDMFMELKQPGTVIGKLTEGVKQKIGFNTNVVMCASHDTASAVMAVPTVSEVDMITDSDILRILWDSGLYSL